MKAFAKALNDVHKLCKGNILYREPSEVLLFEAEYPVPVVEFEKMYDLMMEISKEEIQQDQKVYGMLQDVISCMRDTGMIDSYLHLETFTRGFHPALIAGTTTSNITHNIIEDDYYTRDSKLIFIKKRVDIITNLMYKRNPVHVKKDNERYGDMDDMLSRMNSALRVIKARFDKNHEEEKAAAEIEKKENKVESDGDTSALSESESEREISEDEGVQDVDFVKKIRIPSVVL